VLHWLELSVEMKMMCVSVNGRIWLQAADKEHRLAGDLVDVVISESMSLCSPLGTNHIRG
jgi:exosome complex RNA-binding protein Rrp4